MASPHGLRLRRKDDVAHFRDALPQINAGKDRQGRPGLCSKSFVPLLTVTLAIIGALALLHVFVPDLLQRVLATLDNTADTLHLLDEGLTLQIPGLNVGRLSDKSVLEDWTLQACPLENGDTACTNPLELPLHIQLRILTSSGKIILQAPLWQIIHDTPICNFGWAWKMSPPTQLLLAATKVEVQIQWHRKSCFGGQTVDPWEQTIPLALHLSQQQVATEARRNTTNGGLFVNDAAWQKNTHSQSSKNNDPPYIWAPTQSVQESTSLIQHLTTHDAFVLPDAIVTKDVGYGKFADLGNYELLCFMGNDTQQAIREAFLALRPQIFKGQRPFKFHFYSMADLQQPDRYWDLDKKQRLRKCKHILINFEEFMEPVAQKDYENQIVNLVGHVLRLMDDETFPVRIFTWTQSPVGSRHCHSPYLPWTNDHPCNDVLRKLFDPKTPAFPSRAKLLDNSDLTVPYLDRGSPMRPYILAAIALRVFVLTGDQVATWRFMGQRGAVDGLHRNGEVEPNFDLVPYEDWELPPSDDYEWESDEEPELDKLGNIIVKKVVSEDKEGEILNRVSLEENQTD